MGEKPYKLSVSLSEVLLSYSLEATPAFKSTYEIFIMNTGSNECVKIEKLGSFFLFGLSNSE